MQGKGVGQQALQKAIIGLKKKISQTISDVSECEEDIKSYKKSIAQVETQISESLESCQKLEEKQNDLSYGIEQKSIQKQLVVCFYIACK